MKSINKDLPLSPLQNHIKELKLRLDEQDYSGAYKRWELVYAKLTCLFLPYLLL